MSSKMDIIFQVNFFRLYLKVKFKFFNNCTRKNLFLNECYYWNGTISLQEVDQNFLYGGKLARETRTWTLSSDYMQYYTMLLEQSDYKPVKDLATATRLVEVHGVVCLVT